MPLCGEQGTTDNALACQDLYEFHSITVHCDHNQKWTSEHPNHL